MNVWVGGGREGRVGEGNGKEEGRRGERWEGGKEGGREGGREEGRGASQSDVQSVSRDEEDGRGERESD